jgi:glycosyltransferase involved in cell wall biosynthesis
LLRTAECPARMRNAKWYLLAPPGATCDLKLAKIEFRVVGRGNGHMWEQSYFAAQSQGGVTLCPANSGPLFRRRQLVIIHDAAVYKAAAGYRWRYRAFHRSLGRLLSKTARIATVSEFSRRELSRVLRMQSSEILLASNGADHLSSTEPDFTVFDRFSINPFRYFVTVGLSNANKNIELAVQAFKKLNRPGASLVIVGQGHARVVGARQLEQFPGLITVGRLTDGEIVALFRRAAAFIFPSRYEGFGLPPLEAMAQGCPVLASTAGAVVEVCGGAALHFHPDDAGELERLMRQILDEPSIGAELRKRGLSRPGQYTWATSASSVINGLATI